VMTVVGGEYESVISADDESCSEGAMMAKVGVDIELGVLEA
jgi:hypothetical protein